MNIDSNIKLSMPVVDMGNSYPLRYKIRQRRQSIGCFIFGLILIVFLLSLPYQGLLPILISSYNLILILAIGGLFALIAISTLLAYVKTEIKDDQVILTIRSPWRKITETELLLNYDGICIVEFPVSSFWGNKRTFWQIYMVHKTLYEKTILLFSGTNKETYEKRIQAYQNLLKMKVIEKNNLFSKYFLLLMTGQPYTDPPS